MSIQQDLFKFYLKNDTAWALLGVEVTPGPSRGWVSTAGGH